MFEGCIEECEECSKSHIFAQCEPMGAAQSNEQPARELRYMEKLKKFKAKISLLEQNLADQPGSWHFQSALESARFCRGRYELCLCSLWDLREVSPRKF